MVGRVVGRTPFGDHDGFLLEPVDGADGGSHDILRVRDAAGLHPGHPA
jgi:hypothetical protein